MEVPDDTLDRLRLRTRPRSDEREADHTMSPVVTRGLDRLGRVREDLRSPRARRRVTSALVSWCAVVAVAAVVGATVAGHTKIGLAFGGLVLVFGIFVADPILIPVIALPASILVERVGGSSTNLSIADLTVFVGAVVSLFHIRWKDARFLKQFLYGVVWYQAVLVLVVLDHPNRYNVVEWFHRFSYVGGSVLVGWVIATNGRTRQAFRLFLAGSAVLAVIAMEHAVTGHFHPAQWGVFQKNTIGAILWAAIVIAQVLPDWMGIGKTEARIEKYLCVGGLLASQSRQSLILVVFSLALAVLLNPEVRRRSKLLLVGAVPLVLVLYYSFSLAARSNPRFNSVSIRFGQIGAALHVWHLSPILGLGMRFYNLPQYVSVTAPPNVFIDNLASTGIVGSLAFVVLFYLTMRTMFRLPAAIGTLGLVILLGHYVDGLFDTFWIGASTITPFMVAGVSLGVADLARSRGDPVAGTPTAGDVVRDTIIGFPTARARDTAGSVRRMVASATTRIAARPDGFFVARVRAAPR
jgi:polysaccharide biosynthesis protein PslJ